jgi:ATP-dependent protease ClpP protease subunit
MSNILLRLVQDSSFHTLHQRDCERIIDELGVYKKAGHHVTLAMESLTGGSSYWGLMVGNIINEFGYDTHAFSDCFSAACLIFAGGHTRTASPTARFMLHEASKGVGPGRDDLQTQISYQRFRQDFGWDEQLIARFFGSREEYLWVDEAKALGLVNHQGPKKYDEMIKFRY